MPSPKVPDAASEDCGTGIHCNPHFYENQERIAAVPWRRRL